MRGGDCDAVHVTIGIGLAAAIEAVEWIALEAELGEVERRMLPGQDQLGLETARSERMRDRSELDRFGPGPDDQP